jgi:hypothetical protein
MEINIHLPKPHPSQQLVINTQKRFKVLQCGRRWGKSLVARIISINKMLKGEYIAYITPTFDLSEHFFTELMDTIPKELIDFYNKKDLRIKLITGGAIKFFSGESLERLRGYKFHYVIVDEAAYIPDLEKCWYSSIRPTLSDYMGGGLFISTPNGKEFFHSLYIKGMDENDTEFKSFRFPSNDNPYFPAAEFKAVQDKLPPFQFRQEYLAIPGENKDNPFGTDNIKFNIVEELSNEPTIIYGIDVAKYNDYSVIIGLDSNGHMTYFSRFQLPWITTMEKIKDLPKDIHKVIDSTGVGDVLLEQLYQVTENISGFKFTSESKPKLIYNLIKDVEKGRVKYLPQVAEEMYVFEYKYTSNGHIKFDARPGFHDDCIIALALANEHKNMSEVYQDWKLYFV